MSEKPKWEKPMLNVLVRGKAEEYVLTTCKYYPIQGPIAGHFACGGEGCPGNPCVDLNIS